VVEATLRTIYRVNLVAVSNSYRHCKAAPESESEQTERAGARAGAC